MTQRGVFSGLYEGLKSGTMTRRQFIERATAAGMSLAVAGFVVNSLGAAPPRLAGVDDRVGNHRHRPQGLPRRLARP